MKSHAWILLTLYILCGSPSIAGEFPSAGEIDRARPGKVLRVMPLLGGAFGSARAYRALYRSTDFTGKPTVISGAFFIPSGSAPDAGRDIVAWAHPTTGVNDKCAPTVRDEAGTAIPGLEEMLNRGWAVAATDYEGLGTPGIHPYLSGASEARSIADSLTALAELMHGKVSGRYAVWGHSQGGHAALFADQYSSETRPAFHLVGVAAAAPPTDLAAVLESNRSRGVGADLEAMTIWSWTRAYKLPLEPLVNRSRLPAINRVASDCLQSVADYIQLLDDQKKLGNFLEMDPDRDPSWRKVMDENSPQPGKLRAPMFISQDLDDEIVPASITTKFVKQVCASGGVVRYYEIEDSSHIEVARDTAREAIAWIANRFEGKPPPNDCAAR